MMRRLSLEGALPPMTGTRVAALTISAVGVLAVILSARLQLGSAAKPGPGLWPLLIGTAVTALGICLLWTHRPDQEEQAGHETTVRVLAAAVSLMVFVLAFTWIGLLIPTFVTLLMWVRFLGNESWLTSVITSALATAACHVVFVILLGVPFPPDLLLGGT
jgi:putative tricarboxylic transport membrane protein